jgi:solute carrier family 38 (sodium-coupled neutral amino acid transporter), member 2
LRGSTLLQQASFLFTEYFAGSLMDRFLLHPPSLSLQTVSDSLRYTSAVSVALAIVFFYILFGDDTLDDVLANFDSNLGIPYSSLFNDAVRVSYVLHLMLVFPIVFHALQLNMDGLLFPSARPQPMRSQCAVNYPLFVFILPLSCDNRRFGVLTAALLVVIFLAAKSIPNIWDAFQFTGATASVAVAYIFPAGIVLRLFIISHIYYTE